MFAGRCGRASWSTTIRRQAEHEPGGPFSQSFAPERRIAIITGSIGFNVNPIEQGSRAEPEAQIPAASAGRWQRPPRTPMARYRIVLHLAVRVTRSMNGTKGGRR